MLNLAHNLDKIGKYHLADCALRCAQEAQEIQEEDLSPQEVSDEQTFAGTYWIPEENLEKLNIGLTKMNKTIEKLRLLHPDENFEPIKLELGGEKFVEVPDKSRYDLESGFDAGGWGGVRPTQFKKRVRYIEVTITGPAPRLSGWNFIARILHGVDDKGKAMNTFLGVPGKEVDPRYREVPPRCEHCNQNRARKDTFLLQHPEKGYKQVGSSCLADFLGSSNPQVLASYLTSLDELRESLRGAGGGRGVEYIDAEQFDTLASFIADKFGYMSYAKSEESGVPSTSSVIRAFLEYPRAKQEERERLLKIFRRYFSAWETLSAEEKEKYKNIGKEAVERAKALKDDPNANDFQWNLSTAAHGQAVDPRKFGLRAYVPADMLRARFKEQQALQAQQAASQEVANQPQAEPVNYGRPGDQFLAPVTLISTNPIDSQYGISTIHKFKDPTGKILTWFASGANKIGQDGEQMTIRGLVKRFDNFRGQEQVVVKNVKKIDPKTGKPIKEIVAPSAPQESRGRL